MCNNLFKSAILLMAVSGCGSKAPQTEIAPGESTPRSAPMARVKPDIDYSKESPDCKTAGQRIARYVEVGMSQNDVARLVGKPQWNLPGSWWWSPSFSKTGKPTVFFNVLDNPDNPRVSSISADTSEC